jgi:hypothetical protein
MFKKYKKSIKKVHFLFKLFEIKLFEKKKKKKKKKKDSKVNQFFPWQKSDI